MFDWENAIALETIKGNRASSRREGKVSWVFSSCGRNLRYILELQRGCPFETLVCSLKSLKKNEHRSIDAFKLWCWRRLLRVPRTARRSNQSILKDINPEYSLEGLMLELKLQPPVEKSCLIRKDPGYWERWRAGGGRGWQRMRWLDDIINLIGISLSKLHEIVKDKHDMLQFKRSQRVRHNLATLTNIIKSACSLRS